MADRDDKDLSGAAKMNRRGLLKCMAWTGTGVVWTLSGGVPRTLGLIGGAAAAEVPQGALTFVFASREDRLAVLERRAVGRNNQYRTDPRRYRQDASPSSHVRSLQVVPEQTSDSNALFRAVSGWNKSGARPVCSASHTTPIRRDRWPIVTTKIRETARQYGPGAEGS